MEGALLTAGPKPDALTANREQKKGYAERLSRELALMVAACLRPRYKNARLTPREDGSGQEYSVGGKIDSKKTDVGVWDDAAGLILGVSIKTYSFRDFHKARDGKPAYVGRYARNVKRNDMELRDEADILHRRQPYAVLVALFFLPESACWDGVSGHSSFAHIVFTLRKRTGRRAADAPRYDLFEAVYVGLYRDDGSVRFFDVAQAPPLNQPPMEGKTVSLAELVDRMTEAVTIRNVGMTEAERYAPDDAAWTVPPGSLPTGLADEKPLDFDAVLAAGEADLDAEEQDE
jgi:hypothetical protein